MERIPDYRLDPPPEKYTIPPCPTCGTSMYDWLLEDVCGDIVGCSECTKCVTAEEYLEMLSDN